MFFFWYYYFQSSQRNRSQDHCSVSQFTGGAHGTESFVERSKRCHGKNFTNCGSVCHGWRTRDEVRLCEKS